MANPEEGGKPLKVHNLRPAPGAKTAKTRVGRGEASKGKTAGRGTKGSKARYQVPVGFEGGQMPIHMRLPKLKGFKNPFKVEFQVVNLDRLNDLFPEGGTVGVDELVLRHLLPLAHQRHVLLVHRGAHDQVLRPHVGDQHNGVVDVEVRPRRHRPVEHDAVDRAPERLLLEVPQRDAVSGFGDLQVRLQPQLGRRLLGFQPL